MLIVLTQQGTRCGHRPGKVRKHFSAYTTAVETEGKFVQVGLEIRAGCISIQRLRVAARSGFPRPKVGSRIVVPKEKFVKWVEQHTQGGEGG